jgi:hypothetical protein
MEPRPGRIFPAGHGLPFLVNVPLIAHSILRAGGILDKLHSGFGRSRRRRRFLWR